MTNMEAMAYLKKSCQGLSVYFALLNATGCWLQQYGGPGRNLGKWNHDVMDQQSPALHARYKLKHAGTVLEFLAASDYITHVQSICRIYR